MPRFVAAGPADRRPAGVDLGADLRVDPSARLRDRRRSSRCLLIPPVVVALVAQLDRRRRGAAPDPVQPGRPPRRHERRDLRDRSRQPDHRQPRHLRAACTSARRWSLTARRDRPDRPPLPADRGMTEPPCRRVARAGPAARPSCRPSRRPRLALVRQRRRRQRHLVRARPRRHRPARPERRRQVDPPAPDGRAAASRRRGGPRRRADGLGPPRDVRADRHRPGARGRPLVPHRPRVRAPQRPAPGPRRPGPRPRPARSPRSS